MELDDLARQVRALADRAAVLDVVTTYAIAVDSRDWDLLESLFTPDARADYGGSVGTAHGPAEIVAAIRRALSGLDGTQHLTSNSRVTLHGDEAAHVAYVQGQHLRRGVPGGELYVVAGRYDDRLRRTGDGWRFAHRSLTRMWTDGNRTVLHP